MNIGYDRHIMMWASSVNYHIKFQFLQTFSLSSSNYMLVAIALDRHRAITKPLLVPSSSYRLPLMAWLLSLLPSLPCLLIFHVKTRPSQLSSLYQPECVSDFSDWPQLVRKFYFSGVALLIFIIPLLLMIILNSHIVFRLYNTINCPIQNVGTLQWSKYL